MDSGTHRACILCVFDTYLINTGHGVIVDVEATRSIRQAEVGSTKTMLTRVKKRFDPHPENLIADTAYGTGPLLGWFVDRKIAPHIPVFDKAGRSDGTWSRADFERDAENDQYICPEGHELKQFCRNHSDPNRGPTGKGTARYRALKEICQACPSKAKCCPNADARKITREETEDARQVVRDIHCLAVHVYMHERGQDPPVRHLDEAQKEGGNALRPPQTHPRTGTAAPPRPLRGKRVRFGLTRPHWGHGPGSRHPCRHRPEPPQTGQDLSRTAATAQNLIGKVLTLQMDRYSLRPQHVFLTEAVGS